LGTHHATKSHTGRIVALGKVQHLQPQKTKNQQKA